ncbi:MFS transporter [Lysinibacillus sphaericus]|uniref:MFS transporter n=3 Tax=Lysinibacillus TaxID=400634 RepID=A0A2S0K3C1_LYSSH|nr:MULTISPECIES: MFS transporter [Lysinibacillus]AHN21061.1 macrolide transporter [Lysinibacillus varians]AVK97841.1 MFS transporter [Lysinibacillus sphaericus]MCS1381018.1 MFS transporter [Lysinibacillus sphaericus]MED4543330.1 MFS transporter [Lysinibacillus sphaericus]TKI21075.1 MFS transporter [Lysinibacillus sphaericus]
MNDVKTDAGFKKFLVIWMGELISNIGTGMTAFGLGVYVWQLTKSALDVAMVEMAALLPMILFSPAAGVLADRFDRRLLMIIGDCVSGLGLVLLLVLMNTGNIQVWQICLCVGFSSAFASLLDPAYKATLTDLLSEDEYAKASGMVGIASSSKFLISPIIGGLILAFYSMELIIIIDILTLAVTVSTILFVRKSLSVKPLEKKDLDFFKDLKEGWQIIVESKGVMLLIVLVSVLMFYMGIIQVLSKPMILSFASEKTTGILQTVVACGMMVSSILIGTGIIKRNFVKVMVVSFIVSGITMAGFGATTSIPVIIISGFLFFASLPFATTCIDVLIRKSIDNEKQGRAWGLISLISQIGFVVAYVIAGVLADYVFNPALVEGGVLANSVGKIIGTGETRGIGFLIILSGVGLIITALFVSKSKGIREMEKQKDTELIPTEQSI